MVMNASPPDGTGALDVGLLTELARAAEQLSDFGGAEHAPGLAQLVAALNAGPMTEAQRTEAADRIVRRLRVALRMQAWLTENPGVPDEAIEAPLVITGTDPAGVGLLGSVLGFDVLNRTPTKWEAATIAPPPTIVERGHDPRIAEFGVHATAAASCSELLANGFSDPSRSDWMVPDYWKWWTGADLTSGYGFHRLQIQMLQSALPTQRWVFHSASHVWHLDALLHTYPDARVVWIHRDPAHVVERVRTMGRGAAVPGAALGAHAPTFEDVAAGFQASVPASLDARSRHPETSFFDLQYVELIDDPVGAVERFYRDWDISLPELSRWQMQAYLDTDGVMPDAVQPDRALVDRYRTEMSDYVQRFEIPSELASL